MMKPKLIIYIFYFNLNELYLRQKVQNNVIHKLATWYILYLFGACNLRCSLCHYKRIKIILC